MITEGSANPDSNVSCAHARAELDRLLSDPRFHCTDRARKILTYLADRRFLGQSESVKAYTIALDVLGRQSDFDPTTDPIVRIEMSRLRSVLAQYYKAFGDETNVTLTLPKGNYVAAFAYTNGASAEASLAGPQDSSLIKVPLHADETSPVVDTSPDEIQRTSADRPGLGWGFAISIGFVCIVLASAAILYSIPNYTKKPNVAVSMSANERALAGEASLTRDMLLTALTQFNTLNMTTGETSTRTLSNALRPVAANSYTIDLKYLGDTKGRGVWWQVLDSQTGGVFQSGVERVSIDGRSALDVREELVSVLSCEILAE